MCYHFARPLPLLLGIIFCCLVLGCSNSEGVDGTGWDDIIVSQDSDKLDYLPIDDSEYPYAGIPRVVIVTENFRQIRDRETEIPAKLQIWGEKAPESEIMDLTIRGRGNTSWTNMPKKSYKIEFLKKQSMLGMPKDRDWALIANDADKTLMKNYLMNHLSAKLGAYYAPKCEFVELFLNREYLGVYLLTETIKIAKHRINIPKNDSSYIVELSRNSKPQDQIIFVHGISNDSAGAPFHVHHPKNTTKSNLNALKMHLEDFENFLKTISHSKNNDIAKWIDINEFIKHYWVQEFSKNPDASGYASIYLSWTTNDIIKMGPVWDFDLAFGSHSIEKNNQAENWYIKHGFWHPYIFKDSIVNQSRINFWREHEQIFINITNTADSLGSVLQKAAQNNFKRWDILQKTEFIYHRHAYKSYMEAIEDLKNWIFQRIEWIDKEFNTI